MIFFLTAYLLKVERKGENMNREQYERAITVLLSALEELGKVATPAHCEAMAKVAEALTELHVRSDRIRG